MVAWAAVLDTESMQWVSRLPVFFDGKAYRLVAHASIDSCGLEQWSRRIRNDRRHPK